MDTMEARRLLLDELGIFRNFEYTGIKERIDTEPYTNEFKLENGNWYQIEISFFRDDRPDGDNRVIGSVDDGGWRVHIPVTESFIVSSSGKLMDE
jgi:hypothetical protein